MIVSLSEIILTILALIACWIYMARVSVPALLEWLEAMNTDETSVRKEDDDG